MKDKNCRICGEPIEPEGRVCPACRELPHEKFALLINLAAIEQQLERIASTLEEHHDRD